MIVLSIGHTRITGDGAFLEGVESDKINRWVQTWTHFSSQQSTLRDWLRYRKLVGEHDDVWLCYSKSSSLPFISGGHGSRSNVQEHRGRALRPGRVHGALWNLSAPIVVPLLKCEACQLCRCLLVFFKNVQRFFYLWAVFRVQRTWFCVSNLLIGNWLELLVNLDHPIQEINTYQDILWCWWNQNNDRWTSMLFNSTM